MVVGAVSENKAVLKGDSIGIKKVPDSIPVNPKSTFDCEVTENDKNMGLQVERENKAGLNEDSTCIEIKKIKDAIEKKKEELVLLQEEYRKKPDIIMGNIGALTGGFAGFAASPLIVKGGAYLGVCVTKGITGLLIGGIFGAVAATAVIAGTAYLLGKACQHAFASEEELQQIQNAENLYENKIKPLRHEIIQLEIQLENLERSN